MEEDLFCDGNIFVGDVYDRALPVYADGGDFDNLEPYKKYVVYVQSRVTGLIERVQSLNYVYRLLAMDSLPLETPRGPISRENWLRVTLDVLLSRLTSIRDCSNLLVAEVFELGLTPRQVSLDKIKKAHEVPSFPFWTLLEDISVIGLAFRNERDVHLHRGEQRKFSIDDFEHFFYTSASDLECIGQKAVAKNSEGHDYDLKDLHTKLAGQIEQEFSPEALKAEAKIIELFDALQPHFMQRFEALT